MTNPTRDEDAEQYIKKMFPCESPCDSFGICDSCTERNIFESGYNFGIKHARAQDAEWVKALEKTVNIAVKFRDKLSNYAIGCAVVTEEGMDDVDNALLSAFAELEKLRKEREGG